MPYFDPTKLAAWTAGHWTQPTEAALSGWEIDSRKLKPGQVFVALQTEQRNGHDFLAAAASAGASAALVSQPDESISLPQLVVADTLVALQRAARAHRREFSGRVVGITGSAGKTSTKNLLAAMLGPRTWATQGNLNNHLGVPLSLLALDNAKHDFGVIEAGISGPGEMDNLAAMIEPDAVIVTLVDHAHTEGLTDLVGVAREKAKLPEAVPAPGDMVFPAGVASLAAFVALGETRVVVKRVEVLNRPAPQHTAEFLVTHQRGLTMIGYVLEGNVPEIYRLPRTTAGMAQNAALAITMAHRWGRSAAQIQQGINAWRPAALRGEIRYLADRLVYIDCYNANPASMRDAVQAFEGMTTGDDPRLFILGGMEELGAESTQLHADVGRDLPLRVGDQLALIGTGAEAVQAGAVAAGASAAQIEIVAETAQLSRMVAAWSGPVFIKGSRRYRLETVLVEEDANAH